MMGLARPFLWHTVSSQELSNCIAANCYDYAVATGVFFSAYFVGLSSSQNR